LYWSQTVWNNLGMIVGKRIRALREEKKLTRGDLQERTGLQRTYIWRVENGYTVPAIETLEKFARGLKVPIYTFFYEGKKPPPLVRIDANSGLWGAAGEQKKMLYKFRRYLSQIDESERSLLLYLAEEMARRKDAKVKNK
jgi:transcriptional regulator with XRE-family HTH domain